MITTVNQDIFDADIQAIVHQANCQCTMGSGIARALRDRWPVVYDMDCHTTKGDRTKLGEFSLADIHDETSPVKWVFNMYSQFRYGRDERHTDYIAMAKGFDNIKRYIEVSKTPIMTLGLPYKIGCNLGGGDFNVVSMLIEDAFKDAMFDVLICKKD